LAKDNQGSIYPESERREFVDVCWNQMASVQMYVLMVDFEKQQKKKEWPFPNLWMNTLDGFPSSLFVLGLPPSWTCSKISPKQFYVECACSKRRFFFLPVGLQRHWLHFWNPSPASINIICPSREKGVDGRFGSGTEKRKYGMPFSSVFHLSRLCI
jgi:hypothetical protein